MKNKRFHPQICALNRLSHVTATQALIFSSVNTLDSVLSGFLLKPLAFIAFVVIYFLSQVHRKSTFNRKYDSKTCTLPYLFRDNVLQSEGYDNEFKE